MFPSKEIITMDTSVKPYKYFTLITMVAAIILPCSAIVTNKIVSIGSGYASGGTLILPLWFIFGDIITEVYGYKKFRQFFWYAVTGGNIFVWRIIKNVKSVIILIFGGNSR